MHGSLYDFVHFSPTRNFIRLRERMTGHRAELVEAKGVCQLLSNVRKHYTARYLLITKSCTRYRSCAGSLFELQELASAKLTHEILYVIVYDKADDLACIIEFLFNLVHDINGIAGTRHTSLRGL